MSAVGWPIGRGDQVLLERSGNPGRPRLHPKLHRTWATVLSVTRATVTVRVPGGADSLTVHRDHVGAQHHAADCCHQP